MNRRSFFGVVVGAVCGAGAVRPSSAPFMAFGRGSLFVLHGRERIMSARVSAGEVQRLARITAQIRSVNIQFQSNVEELKRLIGDGTGTIRAMKSR